MHAHRAPILAVLVVVVLAAGSALTAPPAAQAQIPLPALPNPFDLGLVTWAN